jgi:hypothetical protein
MIEQIQSAARCQTQKERRILRNFFTVENFIGKYHFYN